MSNPFENRDLHTVLRFPTLSWSSFCAFRDYDKEKWYRQYVLGERGLSNPAMDAGRVIGERLATDPKYLPKVPRPEIYEQELRADLDGIDLVGHLDGWSPGVPGIDEYKTTQNAKKWTQESVDGWGQITFYCLLVWLNFKIHPADLKLSLTAIHLKESGSFKLEPTGKVVTFNTKRNMADLLRFAAEIKAIHKEMCDFVALKLAMG